MTPQSRITVKPVIFTPKGVAKNATWSNLWLAHIQTARQKFLAMLQERDTFVIAAPVLQVSGQCTVAEYMAQQVRTGSSDTPAGVIVKQTFGYEHILAELMTHPTLNPEGKFHRYNFPYCLAVLLVDPDNAWHGGGGRCFNGQMNGGAGFCIIPTRHHGLGQLQSTVLHELGHAFGLVHVQDRVGGLNKNTSLYKCYYDEHKSPSIMSQNTHNHSNALDPTKVPGCLLGDEIDSLRQNTLTFPKLFFDPKTDFAACDVRPECRAHDGVSRQNFLGPMTFYWCYTDSGAAFGSAIQNLNDTPQRRIRANSAAVGFDPATMWHSGPVNSMGWVSLELTFPIATALDGVRVHSQHSGKFHRAKEFQIEAADKTGAFQFITRKSVGSANATIQFPVTSAQKWKLAFRGDVGGHVVIRGLRFFCGAQELYPLPAD
jgi:hypothetical protein